MAKSEAPKRKRRQSKAVTSDVVEEENNVNEGQTETSEMKHEAVDQDEQDPQMVIEVKANTPTVTVCWEKKKEEAEETEQKRDSSNQISVGETICTESQMDTATEEIKSAQSAVTVTWEKKDEEGQDNPTEQETKAVKGKRKAASNIESSPSKKTKLINDGFCIFVGNLNKLKKSEEVKESLASYFMTQSLLFQNIRLDKSRKYAYVDLASEMDLTKALTLNGEMILDQPMKIAKAKVKTEEEVNVKPKLDKAEKDSRCLFLKNVPYKATRKDILKIFTEAISVRFPGGAKSPTQGIAFVQFKNEEIAKKVLQENQGAKIKDRLLIVDTVGDKRDIKAKDKKAAPNNILFVSNLPHKLKEQSLKKVFKKAVSIKMKKGKASGYAFVEFATVEEAEKALQEAQNQKFSKKTISVQFFEDRSQGKVEAKTLIVSRLNKKTTAETLQNAFEGALSARIATDEETGVSKSFGFVEFENEETCKTAKEAMVDCEIDGYKVAVGYARPKTKKPGQGARGGVKGRPTDQPAGRVAGKEERGGKGGKAGKAVELKTLIVSRLNKETTAETLENAFKGALSARIAVDKETGVSKSFGFVEFENEKMCKTAKKAMVDCEIDGYKVAVGFAKTQTMKPAQGARGGVKEARGGKARRAGKGRGANAPAVKEVENKG